MTPAQIQAALNAGNPLRFRRTDPASGRIVQADWLADAARAGHKIELRNAIIRGPLDLRNVTIAEEFSLIRCVVKDRADFSHATLEKNLILSGTRFERGANMACAELKQGGRFSSVQFRHIPACFREMHVQGAFRARRIRFSTEVKAEFQAAQFDKAVNFWGAWFGGVADFEQVSIGGQADFGHAVFKRKLSFNAATTKGAIFFRADENFTGAIFEGEADFIAAQISSQAAFQGTIFKQNVTFNSAKIGGAMLFRFEDPIPAARFEAEADFTAVQVGLNAEFDKVHFTCLARKNDKAQLPVVDFNMAKIAGYAFFRGVEFAGYVPFFGIDVIGQIEFQGATFAGEADFSGVHIGRAAEFGDATFGQEVWFDGAHFDRNAEFSTTVFKDNASFTETTFRTVFFAKNGQVPTAPTAPPASPTEQFHGDVGLHGCTYERIVVHLGSLFECLRKHSAYDRQPYTQLEKTLRTVGRDREAEQVYLERCKVERQHKRKWNWCLDCLYWLGANYGVRPFRLLWGSLAMVLLAAAIFDSPEAMQKKKTTGVAANQAAAVDPPLCFTDAVRMSFRLFLPVELPLLKDWEPTENTWRVVWRPGAQEPFLIVRYADLATGLRIIGWILVPVGIAAFTGLLRRSDR